MGWDRSVMINRLGSQTMAQMSSISYLLQKNSKVFTAAILFFVLTLVGEESRDNFLPQQGSAVFICALKFLCRLDRRWWSETTLPQLHKDHHDGR
jgi:hypothetical protein